MRRAMWLIVGQWKISYKKILLFPQRYVLSLYDDISMPMPCHQNAFSSKLAAFGFNMFDMLAVDLMHEVELGVWKAVFIHLLRVLDCQDGSLKHELDRRQASFKA
jgi:hypothetical protein